MVYQTGIDPRYLCVLYLKLRCHKNSVKKNRAYVRFLLTSNFERCYNCFLNQDEPSGGINPLFAGWVGMSAGALSRTVSYFEAA